MRSRKEATLSIRLVWPFARLVGTDPRVVGILGRTGVGLEGFASPDTRLPHRIVMQMLGEIVDLLDQPTIGLRAGNQLDQGDFDVLEQAARSTKNLGESIHLMARYFRIMNEGAEISLVPHGDLVEWRFRIIDGVYQPPAANDFAVTSALAFSRRNSAVVEPPVEVHLVHEKPAYADLYAEYFAAPVRYGARDNAILIKKSRLEVPMVRANRELSAAFEMQARQILGRLEDQQTTTARVREEINNQLASGQLSMHLSARRMAMSVATLRRRLEEEGTTFSQIVDDLRRQLAERFLRERGTAVSEIAFLLGFSNVTAFGRAFKRWLGVSPSEYRSNHRAS